MGGRWEGEGRVRVMARVRGGLGVGEWRERVRGG